MKQVFTPLKVIEEERQKAREKTRIETPPEDIGKRLAKGELYDCPECGDIYPASTFDLSSDCPTCGTDVSEGD